MGLGNCRGRTGGLERLKGMKIGDSREDWSCSLLQLCSYVGRAAAVNEMSAMVQRSEEAVVEEEDHGVHWRKS